MACLNDDGYKSAEKTRAKAVKYAQNLRTIVATAETAANILQMFDAYKKQYDIEDRTIKISEDQQQHLKTVYWPRELDFLKEYASPQTYEDVETRGRRLAGRLVPTVAAKFTKPFNDIKCGASRYCTSAKVKALQDLTIAKAQAIGNARVLGRLIAFNEIRGLKDRDYKRRVQAIALGKDLMQEAARLLNDAEKGLAASGQMFAQRVSEGLQRIGFASTYDPGYSKEMLDILNSRSQTSPATYTTQGTPLSPSLAFANQPWDYDFSKTTTHTDMGVQSQFGLGPISKTDPGMDTTQPMMAEITNSGRIGQPDLVRGGKFTFTVEGQAVVVDLDKFNFFDAINQKPIGKAKYMGM